MARLFGLALGSIGLMGGSLFTAVAPAGAAATNQYDLSQCANGGKGTLAACAGKQYQHGDLNANNSHWAEGDFVPFQLVLTGITAGSHTVTIQYETVKSGLHAYDYLGSFDATESTSAVATLAHANANNPCGAAISGCDPTAPTSTHDIPAPDLSGLNAACTSTGTPPSLAATTGKFSLWGPTGSALNSATYESPINQTVHSGSKVSACRTLIDVGFTSPADGSTMVLAWSGHVASSLDWGPNTSAGSISGSPYHMWVEGIDGQGGAQERSMKVSASQPTIATVIEDAAGTPVTTVPSGTSVHDTATLTGASSTAGGTVTYELFDNGTCDGQPATTFAPVTVTNGVVPASPSTSLTAGTYSFEAIYSGDGTDAPATGACEGPLTVTEETAPIINVVKSEPTPGNGQTVTAGQTAPITYQLAVTNSGSAAASNVVVTDVIPTGTTYVDNSATPAADASFDQTTNTITWTIPTVSAESGSTPGEVDLTFKATVNPSDANGSTIVNVASFTNVNTPGCIPASTGSSDASTKSVALTCLTNQVSNPVTVAQQGGGGQQTTTTTTAAPTTTIAKPTLAFTGSRAAVLGAIGAGLIGSGGLVLLINRRRREETA